MITRVCPSSESVSDWKSFWRYLADAVYCTDVKSVEFPPSMLYEEFMFDASVFSNMPYSAITIPAMVAEGPLVFCHMTYFSSDL